MFLITPLITNHDPLKSLLFPFLTTMTALEKLQVTTSGLNPFMTSPARVPPQHLFPHLKMLFWGPNGKYLVGPQEIINLIKDFSAMRQKIGLVFIQESNHNILELIFYFY